MTTRKLHPNQEIVGLAGLTVEDFWIWAFSDMLEKSMRAAFAEFLVGFALGRLNKPRTEWDTSDFFYRDKRVTVKSASYVQSWEQNKKTKINFDVARKIEGRPGANRKSGTAERPADCYVFALFAFEDYDDKTTAVSRFLSTDAWRFYVVPTKKINKELGNQKTVGIRWLDDACQPDGPASFSELKRRIDRVLGFED
jgi:hypothetical protein